MFYNNRLYPHPVLGIGDDVEGTLFVELRVSSTVDYTAIDPTFKLDNDEIQNLIKHNKALFVVHMYCSGTMFRKVYKTNRNIPETIKINSNRINGEVELDFFICANENILNYTNKKFNKDYQGFLFSLDKGDIMAYGGKGKFYANKAPEELKSISALMNVANSEKSNKPMFNEYSGERITIMLNPDDYTNYQIIQRNQLWINLLLSSVVFPCLVEALHFLSSSDAKEFSDRQWFKVLSEIKNKSKDGSAIEIAQRILDLPNNRSFNTLNQLFED